jgi:hypothetical protein
METSLLVFENPWDKPRKDVRLEDVAEVSIVIAFIGRKAEVIPVTSGFDGNLFEDSPRISARCVRSN